VHPDLRHTHGRPDHTQAPPPRIRRPLRVMHRRAFSRGVPLPGARGPCNARPGRASWSFPRLVRRRSWGSVRAALRRFDPARPVVRTSPCDRARVSFVPPHPPDYFSSGGRCSGVSDPVEARRPGMRWRRLPGFSSDPRSASAALGDRDDPALGFASCRVSGHFFPCIRAGTSPPGSPASGDKSPLNSGARSPIRSWAWGAPSRHDMRGRQFGVNRRRCEARDCGDCSPRSAGPSAY
jgi:hypothetical protein